MTKNLYKGFSFEQYSKNKSIKLYDVELIKKDLLNHIFTRRGERVKMLAYGTRIPDIIFEPLDDETLETINEDIASVVNSEPRVTLLDLRVVPLHDRNVVIVSMRLLYIELNFTDTLDVNIQFQN